MARKTTSSFDNIGNLNKCLGDFVFIKKTAIKLKRKRIKHSCFECRGRGGGASAEFSVWLSFWFCKTLGGRRSERSGKGTGKSKQKNAFQQGP